MSSSMVFLHCGCIIAFLARIGVNFSYLKPLLVVGGWCHLNILGALSSSFWVTLCHRAHLSELPAPEGKLDWNWYWESWSRKYRKEWNLGRKKKGKIVNRSTTKGLQGWLKEKANQWKEDCLDCPGETARRHWAGKSETWAALVQNFTWANLQRSPSAFSTRPEVLMSLPRRSADALWREMQAVQFWLDDLSLILLRGN